MKLKDQQDNIEEKVSKKKYITIKDGNDFRYIAKRMSNAGYEMNHATARNVLMSALRKYLKLIAKEMDMELSPAQLDVMMDNQDVHDSIHDILIKMTDSNTENQIGELKNNHDAA